MFSKKITMDDGTVVKLTAVNLKTIYNQLRKMADYRSHEMARADEEQRAREAIKDRLDAANRQLKLLGYNGEF